MFAEPFQENNRKRCDSLGIFFEYVTFGAYILYRICADKSRKYSMPPI